MSIEGTIFEVREFSLHDGPGIRTTVFFKGCPLRCAWCHNPESISGLPQMQWLENRCIACQSCVPACPQHALRWVAGAAQRDRSACQGCGGCAEACPTNAQELLGKSVGVAELVRELLKDRAYYEKSGGGVTLSGGEPSLQAAFALELLQALRERGISTALDTCGLAQFSVLERLCAQSDLVLYDLKILNSRAHREHTGVENEIILSNLIRLVETRGPTLRLWIRTPLIPGATDSQANLAAIGRFLADHLAGQVERWEICAFNNLCREKYRRLGLDWAYADTPLLDRENLERCGDWACGSGFDPARIFVTGATRAAS
jgi:pyruvate formate lyase activating enzyme